ncbi:MAG: putative phosphoglycerate mutase [Schumannella sp.]|nr:putative phosphoglycerate mutase [Schumannella sp.]
MGTIWLARHGESAGNVASAVAEREGDEVLALDLRDADTPLTDVGRTQAEALGDWLAESAHPARVWCSPYRRARDTAEIACARARIEGRIRFDERLRDRELGVLDLLSSRGVLARHPEEAARRVRLGKFWYRPPGGESWADVALRLRSVLQEITRDDEPTLIVAHDVVVSLVVYVLCGMSENEILTLARERRVGNASVTTLVREGDRWSIEGFAETDHIRQSEAPITTHSEDPHTDVL